MQEKINTYAYFWVSDFDCNPDEITKLLNIEPSAITIKGELINSQNGRTRIRSTWEFRSRLPNTEPFQDAHIENLLSALTDKAEAIEKLQSNFSTGISCVGYYDNTNSGFHLSSDLIKRCAALNLSIDFDLYNYSTSGNTAQN
jgi:hypothetical protein